MSSQQSATERLLHSTEAAKTFSVSPAWLARERWKGTGPALVCVGGPRGRAVRYRVIDLQAWIASNTVSTTRGGDDGRAHR